MTTIQLNHRPYSATAEVPRWFSTTVVLVAVGTTLVMLGLDGRAAWVLDSVATGGAWMAAQGTAASFLVATLALTGICAGAAVRDLRAAADQPQHDVR